MSDTILGQALQVVQASDTTFKYSMVTCAEVLCEVKLWQQQGKLPLLFCQAHLVCVSQHTSPSGDKFWLVNFLIDSDVCFTGNLLLTKQHDELVPIVTEVLVANGGQQA